MLPNKKSLQPISMHDCIEQEKYVIVLRTVPFGQHTHTWYFLNKSGKAEETTRQDEIRIFDSLEDVEFILYRLNDWANYPHAFVHAVLVRTRISIWGDWSMPTKPVSEV